MSKEEEMKSRVSKHQGHRATLMMVDLSGINKGDWYCKDCDEKMCSVDEMEQLRKYLGQA